MTAYERGCAFAYFRPDGTECPEDEAWIRGKGMVKGYTEGYVERPRDRIFAVKAVTPLEKYITSKNVKVVYAKDIK